jgi:hypothetical protein
MRAIFAAGRIAPRGSSLLPCAPKHVLAVALLGCFIAGAFAAARGNADVARSEPTDAQSVDRTHKGDRLPLTAKVTFTTSSPLVCDGHRWGVTPHSAATPTRRVAISLAAVFREWQEAPIAHRQPASWYFQAESASHEDLSPPLPRSAQRRRYHTSLRSP